MSAPVVAKISLCVRARLPARQELERPPLPREIDFQIKSLCHGDAKATPCHWLDRVAIHRHKPRRNAAGINPEHSCRCRIDDPQQNAPSGLNRDHLWVGKCAVIGKIGVEIEIVQVHRHSAHGHMPIVHCSGHVHAGMIHARHAALRAHAGHIVMCGPRL